MTIVSIVALYAGGSIIIKSARDKRQASSAASAPPGGKEMSGEAAGAVDEASTSACIVGHIEELSKPAAVSGAVSVSSDPEVSKADPETLVLEVATPVRAVELNVAIDKKADPAPLSLPIARCLCIGAIGGFISSVGGLGGPVVLMPLFFVFMPPLDMKILIGLTSPTACTIIASSMAGGIIFGTPDYGLALVFGLQKPSR